MEKISEKMFGTRKGKSGERQREEEKIEWRKTEGRDTEKGER